MRLYKRINGKAASNRKNDLPVPRFITLLQKCVEHKIPDCVITRTHFNDLHLLIMSLDIANIKQALKQRAKAEYGKRGIEMRDISPDEAVKMLKGGGGNGR